MGAFNSRWRQRLPGSDGRNLWSGEILSWFSTTCDTLAGSMDDTPGPVPSLSDLIRGCNEPTLGEAAAIYFSIPAVGFRGVILMIPETHHHLGTEVHCLQSYIQASWMTIKNRHSLTKSSASTLLSILLSSYLDKIGMKGISRAQSKVQPPTSCQRPTRGSNRSTVSLLADVSQDYWYCFHWLYSSCSKSQGGRHQVCLGVSIMIFMKACVGEGLFYLFLVLSVFANHG